MALRFGTNRSGEPTDGAGSCASGGGPGPKPSFRRAIRSFRFLVFALLVTSSSMLVLMVASSAAAGLPDGRAYEQATPTEKAGQDAEGQPILDLASPDGSKATYFADGGIPGSTGPGDLPTYLASRGSTQWTSVGALPPSSRGVFGTVQNWDEDLNRVYQGAYVAGQGRAIFERDMDTGVETTIATGSSGPIVYVGGTPDGSFAYFESFSALTPNATEGFGNVYVWNAETRTLRLASALNDETEGEGLSEGAVAGAYPWFTGGEFEYGAYLGYYLPSVGAVSGDGEDLYFSTLTAPHRLYVREHADRPQSPLNGGECTDPSLACTVEASAPQGIVDPEGTKWARFESSAENEEGGSYAYFVSPEKLTPGATTGAGDEGADLYRFDTFTGELKDLVVDHEAGDPAGAEVIATLGTGGGGAYVYFVANGVLASGANHGDCERPNGNHEEVQEFVEGTCNLYVWHDEEIEYIDPVHPDGSNSSDLYDWSPVEYPVTPANQKSSRVSADGRYLVFSSRASLTGYENEGVREWYRFDGSAPRGATNPVCISCDPGGAPPSGGPSLSSIYPFYLAPSNVRAGYVRRNLSANGDRFFFETPDALVPSDTNGVNDVYEWEAVGAPGGSCTAEEADGGCLFLISTGESPSPSYFSDADLEGKNVFFYTSQPKLVRQDTDELVDVYDARIGGGLPSQNEVVVPPCGSGSSCRSSATPPPPASSTGTNTFVGPPNPKPQTCKPGAKKGKRSCGRHGKKKRHKKHGKKHSVKGKSKGAASKRQGSSKGGN